jgi:hypothetical protein
MHQDHFHQLKQNVKEIIVTKHFHRDTHDGFDINQIIDGKHSEYTHLHKWEENIDGHNIFRALQDKTHYVYSIDKNHKLIFLRAFHNFKEYKKFLEDKKQILHMIENV